MTQSDFSRFRLPLSPAWVFQQARTSSEAHLRLPDELFPRLVEQKLFLRGPIEVTLAARPLEHGVGRAELRFELSAELESACGRCGHPLVAEVTVDRTLRLFDLAEEADKAESDRLDEWLETDENDWDALSTEDSQSLLEVIEDELLLAFAEPPVHEVCPSDDGAEFLDSATSPDLPADRQRPFESLAGLMKKTSSRE